MILSDKFYLLILRLLGRVFGLVLVGFSMVFTLSLFSYDSSDNSFNTLSTEGHISNWLGSFGSHISDLSFQLIGFSSFLLALIIFGIGTRMSSREGAVHLLMKIILTPFCLLCFAVFFATLPQPEWWELNSLGGYDGTFILAKITFIPHYVAALIALFLGLTVLSLITEVTFADWVYSLRYGAATIRYAFDRLVNLVRDSDMIKLPSRVKARDKLEECEEGGEGDEEEEDECEYEEEVPEKKTKRKARVGKTKKPKGATKSNYELPDVALLTDRSSENKNKKVSKDSLDGQSKALLQVMEDFGIYGNSLGAKVGPVVTLHEFEPAAGTKASRIIGLSDDIARSMSAVSARIAVIPGKTSIGVELPNQKREMIFLREMLESKDYKSSQHALPMILGKDISGEMVIADLAKMPHLLIAGTTGSGKSVGLNVMILSLLYRMRPDECKFIMIDPKMLELSIYDGIPHLLAPVVTEPAKAVIALKWVIAEMEDRYRLMANFAVRNIAGYNEKAEQAILTGEKFSRKVQTGFDPTTGKAIIEEIEFEPKKLPFIVVVVDEMADLMLVAGKEIEGSVQRLAQMARAAGIHIIMATQRPSVDVITGVIKANFPTRISFQVTSRIDSRTILGTQGAEQLLGQGDMIYMSGGNKLTRSHGPFCSDTEIENVVNFIKSQDVSDIEENEEISFEVAIPDSSGAGGDSSGDGGEEDLYNQAVIIVRRDKKASISYIQRQLRIGYNRAATLVEKMEEAGVVTPPSSSGRREVVED
jgi:S-DNA-T family DNA segregation ATPase FtsK/SpoIIIE